MVDFFFNSIRFLFKFIFYFKLLNCLYNFFVVSHPFSYTFTLNFSSIIYKFLCVTGLIYIRKIYQKFMYINRIMGSYHSWNYENSELWLNILFVVFPRNFVKFLNLRIVIVNCLTHWCYVTFGYIYVNIYKLIIM